MNRQQARELARTTLAGLSSPVVYEAVYEGTRRTFGGISPVACVLSKSLRIYPIASAMWEGIPRLTVAIYVRAEIGDEDAAEDQLDGLVEAALVALKNAGFFVGESDSAPENAPLRNIDGKFYRVELIPINVEEQY